MVQLGYGMAMDRLDKSILTDWLQKPCREPLCYSRTVNYITEWISSGQWDELSKYTEAAWAEKF